VAPLTAVTTVDLAGEASTELKGAPASYKSGDDSVAWQGLAGTMRFTRDLSTYSADITAPGILVTGKDGASASLKALSLKMNQARMADTESVYLGTATLGIDSISVVKNGAPAFDVKNVVMKSPRRARIRVRRRAARPRSPKSAALPQRTDAEYAFSVKHLYARASTSWGADASESQRATMAKGAQGAAVPPAQIAEPRPCRRWPRNTRVAAVSNRFVIERRLHQQGRGNESQR
jgi:hypothetical protein